MFYTKNGQSVRDLVNSSDHDGEDEWFRMLQSQYLNEQRDGSAACIIVSCLILDAWEAETEFVDELDDRLDEFCFGFRFLVWIPSFLIARGRFTCAKQRANNCTNWWREREDSLRDGLPVF